MLNKRRNRVGVVVGSVFTAGILVATAWVILNRQYVLDQFVVWSYQPTSSIALINERSGFSDTGTFYFYASQPELQTSEQFNTNCIRQEIASAILGCYTNQLIYIYDVPDAQLEGVEEVTAAHEMLHAAWERMSESERTKLSSMLDAVYSNINDPKLTERMAYYERTQPGERHNELHSILATEFRNLNSDLESHYAKYFNDRSKVVALYEAYQSIFIALKQQADTASAELSTLKTSIDTKTNQYNSEAASISNAAADLKNSADSVDRTSQSAVNTYNAKRQSLLNRIDALDVLRNTINSDTETYNTNVAAYNKLVVSSNNLNKSLDSTLAPVPSI